MKRFFLKATGCACYDKTGLLYPVEKQINIQSLLQSLGAKRIKWLYQYGWSNQPKVLVFSINPDLKNNLNKVLSTGYGLPVVVNEKW